MIDVTRAAKQFGTQTVLAECTLCIPKGGIYALVGSNGAGKTTLMKIIAGFLQPLAGSICVKGIPVWENREKLQRYIGSLIETPVFYEHLSAQENLNLHLAYMNASGNIEETLRTVGLERVSTKPVAEFSMGMRQRLAIARTILHRPEILLLDEPFNGLDPLAVEEMKQLMMKTASEGTTILISSHILSDVFKMADTVGILAAGKVQKEFQMEQYRHQNEEQLQGEVLAIMRGE